MTDRGRRWALAAALAAAMLSARPAVAQHTLEMLQETGPAENRVDLVVLGDGYTAEELGLFVDDADEALDHLFSGTPYAEYEPLFNVARIDSVSAESGADHPGEDVYVDTWFGCAFDCAGIDRLICCDYGVIFSTAATLYPAYDVLLLVVNDDEYGGSGGPVAVTSTNVWAFDVPPHEFGHTFAALGDEYEDPYPGFVFADVYPNVSPTAGGDLLKWMDWVEDGTPLPTPVSAAVDDHHPVGAYEGACYQAEGLFRPAPDCLMRSLGKTLCPICAEAMVLSFWGYVDPVDAFQPQEEELSGESGDVLALSVEPVRPEPNTMTVRWLVDGEEIPGAGGDALDLEIADLGTGAHEVTCAVEDATGLVIADDEGLLASSVTWTVTRTDADTDTGTAADGGPDVPGDPGGDGCGCGAAGARAATAGGALRLLAGLLAAGRGGR